jgi:hypothetical protein
MVRLQEVPYPTWEKLLELDPFVSPRKPGEKDLPKMMHSRQLNLVSRKGLVILPPSEAPFPASRRRVPISLHPRLTHETGTQQALPPFVTLLQPPNNTDNVDTGIQKH